MASVAFNCAYCGDMGRHITVNNVAPLDEPAVCDKPECRAKDNAVKADQAVLDAKQQLDAAEAEYASRQQAVKDANKEERAAVAEAKKEEKEAEKEASHA